MFEYFANLDSCIHDACQFLGIERREFFELAQSWSAYSHRFSEFERPEDFYAGFVGDMGAANLCANILQQFSRTELYAHIDQLSRIRDDLIFADIGCGSAALSFHLLPRLGTTYFVDVPNLAQDFVRWRCLAHNKTTTWVGDLDSMPGPVEAIICIDVLEHIARSSDFFRKIDARLASSGLLFLQTPWASIVPNPEHLPEAEADWHANGGADLLASTYKQIYAFGVGGLYQKRPITP